MQRTKTITIGEKEITVKEFSVSWIRDYLDQTERPKPSLMDTLFPDRLPAHIVAQSTGISVEEMEDTFAPSELKQIIDVVEDVNPFFFNLMGRMAEVGKEILKQEALKEKASIESAAS